MLSLEIELSTSKLTMGDEWRRLIERARPNVFLDPTAINAVHETGFARTLTLLAWDRSKSPPNLVGLWAVQCGNITPLGPAYLHTPAYEYSYLSNPVVDPAYLDQVIPAFFAALDGAPSLPKVIRLKYLDGGETVPAIMRALVARGSKYQLLSERQRAFATGPGSLKSSGSTRKKMRQDWNRLAKVGAVDVVNDRLSIDDGIETFLAMEKAGWKGRNGSALLSSEAGSRFARRLLSSLAAEEKASVALLRVDRRPIAAQVLLYCGRMAYTWKTAFNEDYGRYSPGALLVDKVATDLFASGVEAIESCSPDGGFMEQMWDDRRPTLDVLADLGSRASVKFAMVSIKETGRNELMKLRNRLRSVKRAKKRKPPDLTAQAS